MPLCPPFALQDGLIRCLDTCCVFALTEAARKVKGAGVVGLNCGMYKRCRPWPKFVQCDE